MCKRTDGNYSVQRQYVVRTELLYITLEQGAEVLEVSPLCTCGLKLQKLGYNSWNGKSEICQ